MIKVVKLNLTNFSDYKNLRLESLKKEPQAYGESYEVLKNMNTSFWQQKLSGTNEAWYGVYDGEKMVGIAEIKFALLKKFSHIAKISGVYVQSKYRGKGIGKMLLDKVVIDAYSQRGIQKIKIIVNVGQLKAVALYKSLGFRKVGIMEKEFRINGKYHRAYLMELLR